MEIDVVKIDEGGRRVITDTVTDESFLTIFLNKHELLTLSCTYKKLKELCIGFLFSAGLVHSLDDIESIFINKENMTSTIELKDKKLKKDILFTRVYTSGCGKGVLFSNVLDLAHQKAVQSDFRIRSEKLIELMRVFEKKSVTFRKTGGVHSGALSDGNTILAFSEDIGRHNSIDKVIGEALYRNLNMKDVIVLTSGRISGDIMYKVQKMGSALIASRSAPTGLAVELAKKWNVTLVGFARGKRMNVYTATERIV